MHTAYDCEQRQMAVKKGTFHMTEGALLTYKKRHIA